MALKEARGRQGGELTFGAQVAQGVHSTGRGRARDNQPVRDVT